MPRESRPSNRLSDGVHALSLQLSIASNMSLSGSFFFDSLALEPLSGQAHEICGGCNGAAAASPPRNLFRFKTALNTMNENPRSLYDLSPVGEQSQRLLLSPRKAKRKIPKVCGGPSWKNAKKKNSLHIAECGVRALSAL